MLPTKTEQKGKERKRSNSMSPTTNSHNRPNLGTNVMMKETQQKQILRWKLTQWPENEWIMSSVSEEKI